jgi:hypothetical protein
MILVFKKQDNLWKETCNITWLDYYFIRICEEIKHDNEWGRDVKYHGMLMN